MIVRWLLLLSLAAAVPRLYLGAIQYIEYDGYWHVFIAVQERWENFRQEYEANFHPPLYYLLLKVATWFGKAPLIYRAISILAGVASVYLVGRIVQKMTTSRAMPLLAAAAFAFSLPPIVMSIEVRSYMLCVFLILVSFSAFLDFPRTRARVVFAIAAILATYSHYSAFFYVFACGVATLAGYAWSGRERLGRRLRADAATYAPIAAAGSFLFFSHTASHAFPPGHLIRFYFQPGTESVWEFLIRNTQFLFNLFLPFQITSTPVFLTLVAVTAALAVVVFRNQPQGKNRNGRIVFLITAVLFAAIVASALARKYPFGGELRQQFVLYPFFLICGFVLFDRLLNVIPGRRSAPILIAAAAGLILIGSAHAFLRHPKVRTDIGAVHMSRFRELYPAPKVVYVDQYNVITFFLHHHDRDWTFVGRSPAEAPMNIYRVGKGGDSFLVVRDLVRWNADPLDQALYRDLTDLFESGVAESLVMFSVRQAPVTTDGDDPTLPHGILRSAAAEGVCVTDLTVTPVNAFVGMRAGACPAGIEALKHCIDCDDMNWRVSYTGQWLRGVFDGASEGTLTYTDEPGATARMTFEGTAVEYIFSKAFNRGFAEIVVDGGPPVEIDLYSPGIEIQSRYRIDGLAPGEHTIEIRASGRKRAKSEGAYIDVDALRVPRTPNQGRNAARSCDIATAARRALSKLWSRQGKKFLQQFRQILWTLSVAKQCNG